MDPRSGEISGAKSGSGSVVSRCPSVLVATSTRYRSALRSTSQLKTIVSPVSGAAVGRPGTGPGGADVLGGVAEVVSGVGPPSPSGGSSRGSTDHTVRPAATSAAVPPATSTRRRLFHHG